MQYHKYRYNYTKWVKQTGWNIFFYEKSGKNIMTYYHLYIILTRDMEL